jgi:hypothetical protein
MQMERGNRSENRLRAGTEAAARAERVSRRLRVPLVVAALLAIPTFAVQEASSGNPRGCHGLGHLGVLAAIALAAVSVDPDLGLYPVAAGWAGHAAWDFAHLRADKVVSRSFAKWRAVFDLLGAVGILAVAMLWPRTA